MTDATIADLAKRIDAIEAGYEFMLAYAAQGHGDGDGSGESVREFLQKALDSMDGLSDVAAKLAPNSDGGVEWLDYFAMFERDVERARAVMQLVLAQKSISSELIDNLNASIQVRTLLADIFLIDEALKGSK